MHAVSVSYVAERVSSTKDLYAVLFGSLDKIGELVCIFWLLNKPS